MRVRSVRYHSNSNSNLLASGQTANNVQNASNIHKNTHTKV